MVNSAIPKIIIGHAPTKTNLIPIKRIKKPINSKNIIICFPLRLLLGVI
jgi:hypothetical protein